MLEYRQEPASGIKKGRRGVSKKKTLGKHPVWQSRRTRKKSLRSPRDDQRESLGKEGRSAQEVREGKRSRKKTPIKAGEILELGGKTLAEERERPWREEEICSLSGGGDLLGLTL